MTPFATPRRTGRTGDRRAPQRPDREQREKVLPVSVALDANGAPTARSARNWPRWPSPSAWPRSTGRRWSDASDGKAEALFHRYTAKGATHGRRPRGRPLNEAIGKLPIPKLMSYQRPDGTTVHFVRPAHSLIALFGAEIVPVSVLGLPASNVTLGHRFLSEGTLEIPHAAEYATLLVQNKGRVVASCTDPP